MFSNRGLSLNLSRLVRLKISRVYANFFFFFFWEMNKFLIIGNPDIRILFSSFIRLNIKLILDNCHFTRDFSWPVKPLRMDPMPEAEIFYEYKDKEQQIIDVIRVYNHSEKLTLEFDFSYENDVCVARFSRLIFGHLTARGYLKLEPSSKGWLPYGKWKRFDHDNKVSFSIKYDTDGKVIKQEGSKTSHDEEIEIPDLSSYLPKNIEF